MKKIFITIFIALLGTVFVVAQENSETTVKNSFTIEEATEFAKKHAYEVISTGYEMQQAKKKIWETIATGLPQVSAEANYNDNLELQTSLLPAKIFDPEAGDDAFVPVKFGQQYTSDASITATQLIFDGTYIVGLKASKVYYQLSADKMDKVKEGIQEGVMLAYYYVLAAEDNYETLKETLASSKKIYEEAKAYYEEGLREDTDADQAALSVANITAKVNEAQRSIVTARMALKYLMGLDVNSRIELESTLDQLINYVLITEQQQALDFSTHIDYRILETQLQAQQLMVKKEQATYLPTLSAFYRYGKNASTNEWNVFDKDTEWFTSSILGFKISLPVFSSGIRYSKVMQQKLALYEVENQIDQKLQEMKQNKLVAENDLATAKANYFTSEKSKQLAKKIFDKTKLKYTEGVSNSFELSQNEQQYLEAHSTHVEATLELLKANIAYEKAIGILLNE
ncbi:outer membrane protein TolC [Balneicella halophila]|uniref:Outer membrane protein TolC n=1 Tax=Balneicella halophila TaxID=1537566 RepID=A0A7L4UQA5_BALHA|nr:TolC family protein [Balneicella halophila]PVX49920.1 outer membrane protein TolC [Balneicella halophila]